MGEAMTPQTAPPPLPPHVSRAIAKCALVLKELEPEDRTNALAALCDFFVKTGGTFTRIDR